MGVLQSQQPEQVDGMGRRLDVEVTGLAGARRGCLLVGNLDVILMRLRPGQERGCSFVRHFGGF